MSTRRALSAFGDSSCRLLGLIHFLLHHLAISQTSPDNLEVTVCLLLSVEEMMATRPVVHKPSDRAWWKSRTVSQSQYNTISFFACKPRACLRFLVLMVSLSVFVFGSWIIGNRVATGYHQLCSVLATSWCRYLLVVIAYLRFPAGR